MKFFKAIKAYIEWLGGLYVALLKDRKTSTAFKILFTLLLIAAAAGLDIIPIIGIAELVAGNTQEAINAFIWTFIYHSLIAAGLITLGFVEYRQDQK